MKKIYSRDELLEIANNEYFVNDVDALPKFNSQ